MFDSAGRTYDVTRLLTHEDEFDHAKYAAYSQVSALFATDTNKMLNICRYTYQ